jgi:uncharacterized protein YdhG (YjbR/CyaY superfamily)
MPTKPPVPKTIDEYIATLPADVQPILQKVRQTINKAAPKAVEKVAYGMPTLVLNGKYLVHYAGAKKHLGLFGLPREHPGFSEDLSAYESGRVTLQFPYDQRMPYGLITKIVKYLVKQSNAQAKEKKKEKKA